MRELDPLSITLAGTHLVEAAAGTGKTHALTALFVRLVTEGGLKPEQVAVVTFTDAATRELRVKVRERLLALAQRIAGAAGLKQDEQLDALAMRLRGMRDAKDRIETALLTLDDATIATIHGFCRRVLLDFALEAGASFADVEPSAGTVVRERALRDFWRAAVVGADAAEATWVTSWCATPHELGRWIEAPLRVPAERVEPDPSPREVAELANALEWSRRAGAAMVTAIEAELDAILASKAFSIDKQKGSPYRPENFAERRIALDRWFADPTNPVPLRAFEVLTTRCLDEWRKKDWNPTDARVVSWAEATLSVALDHAYARRSAFLQRALAHVRHAMAEHQREQRVASFDDLITDLWRLLQGRDAPRVLAAIRARYRVALVDEFQDTDAEQYAIFRALFHARDDGGLFLIGDPKQAIYRFRGGDVYAYRDATRDAGANRWSLTVNWRSDQRLLDGVNALFATERAFQHDFIEYQQVSAAPPRPDRVPALAPIDAPVAAGWFENAKPNQLVGREHVAPRILRATAAKIAAFLREQPAGRPLRIAVLVRDRYQVQDVVDELARWQLPANHSTPASVYESNEAYELLVLLDALAEPRDARRARAALATSLFGHDDVSLRALAVDGDAWRDALAQLEALRELVGSVGPAALVRTLAQQCAPRWLAASDGRRRLANLAQLGELLQAAPVAGPPAQLAWLERRMADATHDLDSELRPDSAGAAIDVLTVHKSKGLEWDVVFLPYLWAGKEDRIEDDRIELGRRKPVSWHGEQAGVRVDLGSREWDAHAQLAAAERDAEDVRLAYVALTRAKHQQFLAWGRGWTADVSPLAWLLHRDDGAQAGGFVGLRTMSDQCIASRLREWSARADGAVHVSQVPEVTVREPLRPALSPAQLSVRAFATPIDHRFQVLSFSALFGESSEEKPDHDEAAPAPEPAEPGPVPAFPRGPEFGDTVHGILEKLDLSRPESADNVAWIASQCLAAGYEDDAEDVVRSLVSDTVRAEVLPGVRLADLGRRGARPEIEFFFPLESTNLDAVARALALDSRYERSSAQLARVRPRWHGLMHGYVDLVFAHGGRYGLLDYKTNFLGTRYEDYDAPSLARAVRDADYDLQYLIYTVALVRHLRARLGARFDYARDFAGVSYLFLRGLAGGEGIYRDVPKVEVIEALDAAFGGAR